MKKMIEAIKAFFKRLYQRWFGKSYLERTQYVSNAGTSVAKENIPAGETVNILNTAIKPNQKESKVTTQSVDIFEHVGNAFTQFLATYQPVRPLTLKGLPPLDVNLSGVHSIDIGVVKVVQPIPLEKPAITLPSMEELQNAFRKLMQTKSSTASSEDEQLSRPASKTIRWFFPVNPVKYLVTLKPFAFLTKLMGFFNQSIQAQVIPAKPQLLITRTEQILIKTPSQNFQQMTDSAALEKRFILVKTPEELENERVKQGVQRGLRFFKKVSKPFGQPVMSKELESTVIDVVAGIYTIFRNTLN